MAGFTFTPEFHTHFRVLIDRIPHFSELQCVRNPRWRTAQYAPERHEQHHHDKFYGDRSYCCRDIATFRVFGVKCTSSLGDRAVLNMTQLCQLEITEEKFVILHRYERELGV